MRLASQVFQNTLVLLLTLILLVSSNVISSDPTDQVRQYTRMIEFDYVSWTVDALLLKLGQASLSVPHYLTPDEQHAVVKNYLQLVVDIDRAQHEVEVIYADPKIIDKDAQLKPWQDQLAKLRKQRDLRKKSSKSRSVKSWMSLAWELQVSRSPRCCSIRPLCLMR